MITVPNALGELDAAVAHALETTLGCPLARPAVKQAAFAESLGGLGLRQA